MRATLIAGPCRHNFSEIALSASRTHKASRLREKAQVNEDAVDGRGTEVMPKDGIDHALRAVLCIDWTVIARVRLERQLSPDHGCLEIGVVGRKEDRQTRVHRNAAQKPHRA